MSEQKFRRHDRERQRSRSPQNRSRIKDDYYTNREREQHTRPRRDDREEHNRRRKHRSSREGEEWHTRQRRDSREEGRHRVQEESGEMIEQSDGRIEKRERDKHRSDGRESGRRDDKRKRETPQGRVEQKEGEQNNRRDINTVEVRQKEVQDDDNRGGVITERVDDQQRGDIEERYNDRPDEQQRETKRDKERRQKRQERIAEDEEAKNYKFGGGSRSAAAGGSENDGATGSSGKADDKDKKETKKEEPNFELSGKLTAETNTYKGVVIKYSEPAEARQPTIRWRLYQFKGEEVLPTLYVHRQSAYLIGRHRGIVDIPVDHPSCSSQHAVLQYRLVNYEKKDGSTGKRVRPYLIDLDSTNGTYINNQRIEAARYWELKEQDMIKFGFSSREYVILHENSQDMDNVT